MVVNEKIVKRFVVAISLLFAHIEAQEITHEIIENLVNRYAPEDDLLRNSVVFFPLEQYEVVSSSAMGNFFVEKTSEDMIKRIVKEGWHREWHVAKYFREYARLGSVVIDGGAHIGTHTMTLADAVGPSGQVYAFEPQIKIFTELLVNLTLNDRQNVIPYRLALGNQNKGVEMTPSCSSNEGGCAIGVGGDKVQMVRLDDFHLDNVSLMKIDVEGMEMEVLKGAKETIARNHPVIFIEILGHAGYDGASFEHKRQVEDRLKEIEEMGYSVSYLGIADFMCIPIPDVVENVP